MKKIALFAAAGLLLASVAAIAQMQPPRSGEGGPMPQGHGHMGPGMMHGEMMQGSAMHHGMMGRGGACPVIRRRSPKATRARPA